MGSGDRAVRELTDRQQIGDLLDAYAEAIDARDWDALSEIFAPDAILDYTASGGPRARLPEAVAWLQSALGQVALTQHLVTNRRIVVTGARATCRSSYLNPLQLVKGGNVTLLGGRYEDRLARTRAGWRIAERVQTNLWIQADLPGVQIGG